MFATFDDQGRLFVAESSGLDLYAELTAGTRKCRVSLLEDRDGDGRFEVARVFAEGLVFPMGLAWRDGRLYVADPPDLVTLEDTDGDGRADRRQTILTGFGHTDNGSLHGLSFGPDGLLYMTMGMPDGYRLPRRQGDMARGQERRADSMSARRHAARGSLPWIREPRGGGFPARGRRHRHGQLVPGACRRNPRCARASRGGGTVPLRARRRHAAAGHR